MSTLDVIAIQPRTNIGTTASRRLRRDGLVPVNVYGHGEKEAFGTVGADVASAIARSGAKVVDLKLEGSDEQKAIVREVQWDTFGTHVLHLDFMRVDATQRVTAHVPIHLRGTAPGVIAGGRLDHHLHSLTIECLAVQIPTEINVRITSLKIGDSLHVSDIADLPPGTTVLSPADEVVVQIVEPKGEADATEEAAEPAGE
ncbi:MAG: 50S ribosomal protein L25 [Planctomycetaceae bacterium]|nr:50S ribosomal protein L25 [Planctomycetaceae bacterium]MCB9949754.1 50S ribosomal protein L25 [Planctomycetaceae bacterium]